MSDSRPTRCHDLLSRIYEDFNNGSSMDQDLRKEFLKELDSIGDKVDQLALKRSFGYIADMYTLRRLYETRDIKKVEYETLLKCSDYYIRSVLSGAAKPI